MRKILLFLFCVLSIVVVSAQNHIMLHLAPRLGAAAFQLNMPVSAGSYEYKITRLEYYVSEIKITHDGGQVTPITGLYLLVQPALDSMYDLGTQPDINTVEGITFSIGVDAAHNHDDPASYPASHPLSPQDPAMHWGWSAGYRFVAIEGLAGTDFANEFGIHALGDAIYRTLTLSTPAEITPNGQTIHLIANYANVLLDLDVSGGLIVHASTGEAVTVMNNMRKAVFTAATTATIDPAFMGSFALSPNPASVGQAVATMSLPAGGNYRLIVTDLLGRMVQTQVIPEETRQFSFSRQLRPGTYFVHLWQNNRPVVAEKLVIEQ